MIWTVQVLAFLMWSGIFFQCSDNDISNTAIFFVIDCIYLALYVVNLKM